MKVFGKNVKVLGKTVKAIQNNLNRQRGKRLTDATPTRRNCSMSRFAKAPEIVRRQSVQLRRQGREFASGLAICLPSVKNIARRCDRATENALCYAMAGQAVPFQLPPRFAEDKGYYFVLLVREARNDKKTNHGNQNYNYNTVTGWELWDYIQTHKGTPNSIPSPFASYTEEEVRVLSKNWLQIVGTVKSLPKFLLDYASQNLPEQKAYLDLLGLN